MARDRRGCVTNFNSPFGGRHQENSLHVAVLDNQLMFSPLTSNKGRNGMAKVIDDYLLVQHRGRAQQYPWDEWTDGKTWEVAKGADFTCSLNSFRNGLYSIAKSYDLKVVSATFCEEDDEIIRFRFFDPHAEGDGEDSHADA